jgi:hypothetical protein
MALFFQDFTLEKRGAPKSVEGLLKDCARRSVRDVQYITTPESSAMGDTE